MRRAKIFTALLIAAALLCTAASTGPYKIIIGQAVAAGMGAISHIIGPSDQPLKLASSNAQNVQISPDGAGVIIADQDVRCTDLGLTAGTMTADYTGALRHSIHSYSWTNAMVVTAHGTANKIAICSLPAKTVVRRAYVVITSAADQGATLSVQVGPAGNTDGYVLPGDAKAAANTVYGDAIAEVGADLFTPGDTDDYWMDSLPSYAGATVIEAEFVIGAGTLQDATSSGGTVILETVLLP